jgi:hypothetical protein
MLHGAKDRREGKNLTTKNAEITKVKKDTDDRNGLWELGDKENKKLKS